MPSITKHKCGFVGAGSRQCSQEALAHGYCFWHDPNSDKSGIDIKTPLEKYVRNGEVSQGLQLKRARLEQLDLVNRGASSGFDLRGSDLYRASLRGAHLFSIDLSNSSLMKADLSGANLHCANLKQCNLLGTKLKGTRLDNVNIGKQLLQEKRGHKLWKAGHKQEAFDNFQQAEEVYRDLHKAADSQGLFEMAGYCLHKELTMRRYQMPKPSLKRAISKGIDLFCGYGERPFNVVLFAMLFILVCAVAYFLLGITHQGQLLMFTPETLGMEDVNSALACLYFSVVTFTTLGYGDIAPVGLSRFIAAFEAFTGSFTIALFVVVFVKKMTR
ncbi:MULTISPECIES: pentapeptide repeat-containing protein [Corallincola]|uniref:Pentapeptide repeat-containing protein n=3 Tax=Corallincola TaxID=1775176 RepID=A0A368NUE3_9GAMM|nr:MULTISPECIES: pentapeptide repeat-containing protein [Corallincola]RCU52831.1 pentapeptide repeat-containing protein [Corallincola holothuriorum]TAA48016.1 pentapeptide repeat-containing protein [Corallincola spongiicola]TCI03330.1 pentapeptide repeat-containing protein [Corallincola luteus]